MGTTNETYWLDAFRLGDQRALEHYFKRYHKSLCYFAGKMLNDMQEAEDIVADCFVKLWNGEREINAEQNIKAFLYISCRNACLNHLKRMKIKTVAHTSYSQAIDDTGDNVIDKLIMAEVLDLLNNEIEQLPDKCKEVFKLLYFDHKKTDEIAIALNISVKTVRNHKARAIELLKASVLKKNISLSIYLLVLAIIDKIEY